MSLYKAMEMTSVGERFSMVGRIVFYKLCSSPLAFTEHSMRGGQTL